MLFRVDLVMVEQEEIIRERQADELGKGRIQDKLSHRHLTLNYLTDILNRRITDIYTLSRQPSKHETWINVGALTTTLAQH